MFMYIVLSRLKGNDYECKNVNLQTLPLAVYFLNSSNVFVSVP